MTVLIALGSVYLTGAGIWGIYHFMSWQDLKDITIVREDRKYHARMFLKTPYWFVPALGWLYNNVVQMTKDSHG